MDHQKADRLQSMLQESLQPIVERLDRIEKDINDLKEQQDKSS